MLRDMATKLVIELEPDTVFRLPDAPGAKLTCLVGVVWVTRDGDRADFILEAGASYPFPLVGAVLQAMQSARLAITPASGPALASRLLQFS